MSIEQKSVVITSAVRTAIGKFRGSLKNMQGHELGSVVIKESIKNILDEHFDHMNKISLDLVKKLKRQWNDLKELKRFFHKFYQSSLISADHFTLI